MTARDPRGRAAVVLLAVLLVAGCTSDEPAPGDENPSGTSAGTGGTEPGGDAAPGDDAEPGGQSAEDLTGELLDAETDEEPLASVVGSVTGTAGPVDVTADVLAVEASGSGTRLRWRLRSSSGEPVEVEGFSLAAPPYFDTRAIALADAEGNQLLLPYTYQRTGTDLEARTSCLCSTMPDAVGEVGEDLEALFPPLGEQTTSVDVVIPGFASATGVEVTRT